MLVVDVGTAFTRAILFDDVEGRYRFLGNGTAPSTAGAPFNDVGEGVRNAMDALQEVTGRKLMDAQDRLVMPTASDGSGVDRFAATVSAGPQLKIVVVGLLEDVSLESARRLAMTTYSAAPEVISLNDRRRQEMRIDAILRLHPDLVLIAGGTEGGANQSVMQLVEAVGLACALMPDGQRPEVLFAGNSALKMQVEELFGAPASLHFAPNVRPTLEVEQIDPAATMLAEIVSELRAQRLPGVQELDDWASGGLLPTSAALGRLMRFLSKSLKGSKGVLGVDLGASAAVLAAAFDGNLHMSVHSQLGLGRHLPNLLDWMPLQDITRWLPIDLPSDVATDYIYNKGLYPASVPVTPEELALEQALARQLLHSAMRQAAVGFPPRVAGPGAGFLPYFEPILATGSVLTCAPNLAHTALMLLDGLQPTGITILVLDQNNLAAALGAAAAVNPLLVSQVLDSAAFNYLGTVISPVGGSNPGTPILRLKIHYDDGRENVLTVKQGALETLPLATGQTAQVQLQPYHRYDAGMGGWGRGGNVKVYGGALGLIIDGRGRPLALSEDAGRRRELLKKWLWTLGG
jgi:hypothetical protein